MLLSEILVGECTGHPKERKYYEITLGLLLDLDCARRELPSSSLEEAGDFSLLWIFFCCMLRRSLSVLLGSICSCPLISEWLRGRCSLKRASLRICCCFGFLTLSEKADERWERLCCALKFSIFSLMALMCSLIWRWLRRLQAMASDSSSFAELFRWFICRKDCASLPNGSMWLRLACAGS